MSYKIPGLQKRDRRDLHLHLREDQIAVLDSICVENGCSRAAAVGALLEYFGQRALRGETELVIEPGNVTSVTPRKPKEPKK